jgi:hypothetical protein
MTRLTTHLRNAFADLPHERLGIFHQGLPRYVLDMVRTRVYFAESGRPDPSRRHVESELFHMDLTSVALVCVVGAMRDREQKAKALIRGAVSEIEATRTSLSLYALIRSIVSNLNVMRHAVSTDNIVPLRALRRSHIELSVILLAMLADQKFRIDYVNWTHDGEQSRKHWSKVRPKVAQDCVAAVLDGLPGVVTGDVLRKILRSQYEWLSMFEHGHPVALSVASQYLYELEHPVVSELQRLAEFNYLLLQTLGTLLRRHDWTVDDTETPMFRFEVLVIVQSLLSLQMLQEYNADESTCSSS